MEEMRRQDAAREERRHLERALEQLMERKSTWEQEAEKEAESEPGGKRQTCQKCHFVSGAARNKSHILFTFMAFLNESSVTGCGVQSGQLMHLGVCSKKKKAFQHFSTLRIIYLSGVNIFA